MAHKTNLLLAATARDQLRWARSHIYALLILAPLVLGMIYLTLLQATSYDLKLARPALFLQILLAAAFSFSVMAVSLSRASRELYHLRRPSSFAEALPLTGAEHLHFALAIRAGHNLLLALALLVIHSVLSKESMTGEEILALLIFSALMTVSESYAALSWIRWGHKRGRPRAVMTIALLIISSGACGLLLALFFNEAAAARLAELFQMRAPFWASVFVYAQGCALALIFYLLVHFLHEGWRGEDIDYAHRLEHRDWPEFNFARLLRGRLPRAVCALLSRDLALSLRVFSSAVYVAAGTACLIIILLVTLLLTGALPSVEETLGGLRDLGWMSATWFPSSLAIKTATLLVVTCLASIVPVLVSHQIPHAWLERAVGATGNQLWLAKLWYARLLTLPAAIAIYIVGVLAALIGDTPLSLSYLLPLLAECLWLWWLVSSIMGALAFEMLDRPGLALVLTLSLCLSIGMLTVVLWPMGLGIYGMGVAQARERGIMQAARYLLTEER
ncbi:MAG: hypothetical protein ICV60_15575 [Pyrinomonadaceae bacterium]|nr:hypothetical protein [Pyrinomonadaceae bacterium]